jgi:hypothetical protein
MALVVRLGCNERASNGKDVLTNLGLGSAEHEGHSAVGCLGGSYPIADNSEPDATIDRGFEFPNVVLADAVRPDHCKQNFAHVVIQELNDAKIRIRILHGRKIWAHRHEDRIGHFERCQYASIKTRTRIDNGERKPISQNCERLLDVIKEDTLSILRLFGPE